MRRASGLACIILRRWNLSCSDQDRGRVQALGVWSRGAMACPRTPSGRVACAAVPQHASSHGASCFRQVGRGAARPRRCEGRASLAWVHQGSVAFAALGRVRQTGCDAERLHRCRGAPRGAASREFAWRD